MRLPLVLLLALTAATPLHGQEPIPDPTTDPEAFTRAVLEAWSSGDVDRILTFYTDDIVYEDVPNVDNGWAPIHRGRAEFRQSLMELYAGMPDFGIEFGSARAGDDHLVMEWTMTGTHTGDWEGLPATGRSISIRGISIAELEGGRIARNRDYYDAYLFLVQLGVLPESLPAQEPGQEVPVVDAPSSPVEEVADPFTIAFEPGDTGADMVLRWRTPKSELRSRFPGLTPTTSPASRPGPSGRPGPPTGSGSP